VRIRNERAERSRATSATASIQSARIRLMAESVKVEANVIARHHNPQSSVARALVCYSEYEFRATVLRDKNHGRNATKAPQKNLAKATALFVCTTVFAKCCAGVARRLLLTMFLMVGSLARWCFPPRPPCLPLLGLIASTLHTPEQTTTKQSSSYTS
jgi:hypothetical protein